MKFIKIILAMLSLIHIHGRSLSFLNNHIAATEQAEAADTEVRSSVDAKLCGYAINALR